jgi:tRNA (guanine9-N1)-methyltransferase
MAMQNLCFDKAQLTGIRAAQLPIGRYLSNLPTRKVLTVNQVFEILVKWVETRNWEEALYSVMPKRKLQGIETNKGDANNQPEDGTKQSLTTPNM